MAFINRLGIQRDSVTDATTICQVQTLFENTGRAACGEISPPFTQPRVQKPAAIKAIQTAVASDTLGGWHFRKKLIVMSDTGHGMKFGGVQ
jgi:hypothetical protein